MEENKQNWLAPLIILSLTSHSEHTWVWNLVVWIKTCVAGCQGLRDCWGPSGSCGEEGYFYSLCCFHKFQIRNYNLPITIFWTLKTKSSFSCNGANGSLEASARIWPISEGTRRSEVKKENSQLSIGYQCFLNWWCCTLGIRSHLHQTLLHSLAPKCTTRMPLSSYNN